MKMIEMQHIAARKTRTAPRPCHEMPVPHRDLGPILQKHGFGEIKKIGEGRLPLSVAFRTQD